MWSKISKIYWRCACGRSWRPAESATLYSSAEPRAPYGEQRTKGILIAVRGTKHNLFARLVFFFPHLLFQSFQKRSGALRSHLVTGVTLGPSLTAAAAPLFSRAARVSAARHRRGKKEKRPDNSGSLWFGFAVWVHITNSPTKNAAMLGVFKACGQRQESFPLNALLVWFKHSYCSLI